MVDEAKTFTIPQIPQLGSDTTCCAPKAEQMYSQHQWTKLHKETPRYLRGSERRSFPTSTGSNQSLKNPNVTSEYLTITLQSLSPMCHPTNTMWHPKLSQLSNSTCCQSMSRMEGELSLYIALQIKYKSNLWLRLNLIQITKSNLIQITQFNLIQKTKSNQIKSYDNLRH